jgi:hypothetical protein
MAKFSEGIRKAVFVRQHGRCAMCGMALNELLEETEMNQIEFHHVVPQGAGGLDEADNCVALCTYTLKGAKDGCHFRAHTEGNFRRGTVAPPDMFRFSHGHEYSGHKEWLKRIRIAFPLA